MAQRTLTVKILGDDASLHRAFTRSSRGAGTFERDISKAGRGALAGSGVFRGLGRSIAFASGGFLAFASAGQFLRTSIDAAKEAAVTQAQLAAQFKAAGLALGPYQKEIDGTTERLSALSGFQNDELKAGFVTIFRTTGSVTKGLRDIATAADLARAKHISLAQASLIIAKTEAGNTTLLRRQGFQIGKNVKSEEALAILRRTVAGQARAGSTEQERFGAILHNTEEIIGTGLLPVLNKYLEAGGKWLQQMNESGDLQRKVGDAADAFAGAVNGVVDAVKVADKVTGSFKHTLELIIGLKVASGVAGIARNLGLIGRSASVAKGEVAGLRTSLLSLGNPVVLAAIAAATAVFAGFDSASKHLRSVNVKGGLLTRDTDTGAFSFRPSTANRGSTRPHAVSRQVANQLLNNAGLTDSTGAVDPDVQAKVRHGAARVRDSLTKTIADTFATSSSSNLTASQRNSFFDSTISRILFRGGLGGDQAQLASIEKASALISKRLAVTKDITRKLNLEDQLLQLRSQRRDILKQQTQDANDRARAARDQAKAAAEALKERLKEAAAIRLEQRTSRQFRELGLSSTGDAITPSVANLKKQLGSLASRVDTPRLRSELARIRKVLSEGLVPKDVRAKIAEMMADIRSELGKGGKQLTKFAHTNSDAILEGLGLDARTTRILRQRLSTIGAGGTVPGTRSLAFSGDTTVVHTTVNLDGDRVARNTTKHQRKSRVRRSDSRRGPYAGRN